MDTDAERLMKIIESKHADAGTNSERIIIKWLGWLVWFLHMDKSHRVLYANSDKSVRQTIEQLTKDLYVIRYQQRILARDEQGTRPSSKSSK